jgi:hypothetical protein
MVEREKVLWVRSPLGKLLQQLGEGKQQLENRDPKLDAKAVTAGFLSHAAQLESEGGYMLRSIIGKHELCIHPESVLFRGFTKVGGVPFDHLLGAVLHVICDCHGPSVAYRSGFPFLSLW